MLEHLRDRALRGIYASVFLLGIAMSIAFSVIAVYLRAAKIADETIGSLAAAYAAGGVLASFVLGGVIRRFTAKRTLVAGLLGFACTIGVLPLLGSMVAIATSRFVEGACTVAMWVAYETLFLTRAPPDKRGSVSSLYGISLALGYVVGPVISRGLLPAGGPSLPFFVAGGLSLANALSVQAFVSRDGPSGLTIPPPAAAVSGHSLPPPADDVPDTPAGDVEHAARPNATIGQLAWRLKTSCFGMFAAGYLKASLVLFLPLYLVDHRGVSASAPPLVLASYAAGSLVFGNVGARLGDRHGHLLLMRVLGAAGAVALLGFLVVDVFLGLCAVAAVAGGTLGAVTPIGMALQGAIAARREYAQATALSNGLYACGTLVGPPVTGLVYGASGSFAIGQIALLWVVFAIVCTISANDDPSRRRPQPLL